MTLLRRMLLAGLLTLPLTCVFFGLFACSPLLRAVPLYVGFLCSLLAAYTSGHCVVLFGCLWREFHK